MDDSDFEALAAEAGKTVAGQIKAAVILADFEKLAPMHADPQTRPQAEAMLKAWQADGADPLRKGIAGAWLERAAAVIGSGAAKQVTHPTVGALRALKGTWQAGASKAGQLGAALGEKVAVSPLLSGRLQAAQAVGRAEGEAAAATHWAGGAQPRRGASMTEPGAATPYRQGGAVLTDPIPGSSVAAHAQGMAQAATQAGLRQKTIQTGGDLGAQGATSAFMAAGARRGRKLGRIAFTAGAGAAAIGAAGAAGGAFANHEKKQRAPGAVKA